MLKVLQVKIQEQGSCRFKHSKYAKLDRSNYESTKIIFRPINPLAHQLNKVLDILH